MAIEKLSPCLKPKATIEAIPLVDRKVLRPDLAGLLSGANFADNSLRNRAINAAPLENGYRRKEIADHLGRHDTTVSNILRKLR